MAGITLAQAETLLSAAITSYQAALTSQEYSKSDYRLVRAELKSLSDDVSKWEKLVQRLSRGGIRITGATPC
jgi:5-bromo-4-chloroindolyl phosphate hydrolysis protein